MKNFMAFYRIASYVLLIIAGIWCIFDFFMLLFALGNPVLFLSVFIFTSVIIYSFTSFNFMTNGLQNGKPLKPSLKDWIKVNAYVSIAFGALVIINIITFYSSPSNMAEMMRQANDMQVKMKSPSNITPQVVSAMKGVMSFMVIYALLLLSHVFITLKLVKENGQLFGQKDIEA